MAITKEEQWIEKYKDKVFISPSYGKGWWMENIEGMVKAGTELGCFNGGGYRSVLSNKKSVLLHRIIWTLVNGAIPDGYVIHHKDEDRTNNRIDNLGILEKGKHHSLHNKGDKNPMYGLYGTEHPTGRVTSEMVLDVQKKRVDNLSLRKICKATGLGYGTVWSIVNHNKNRKYLSMEKE